MENTGIKLSRYKHVIWDWNGTLLDDVWLCVEVINTMLAERGLQMMTYVRYRKIFGFPVRDYYLNIGFYFDNEPFEKVGYEFIIGYNKRQYECKLQDYSIEILDYFKKKGVTQSVLSAREQYTLINNIDYFKLRKYFIEISGLEDNFANGKNESGKQMISNLNVDKSAILFIGDTLHDIQIAEENGIDCLLVANGHQSAERLVNKGYPVIDSLQQFYGLLSG